MYMLQTSVAIVAGFVTSPVAGHTARLSGLFEVQVTGPEVQADMTAANTVGAVL